MNAVTINQEQQLFVIPVEGGFTTMGFPFVKESIGQMAAMLNGRKLPDGRVVNIDVDSTGYGTIDQYHQYRNVIDIAGEMKISKTWFNAATPKKVCQILEQYRRTGDALRIFFGNQTSGIDFMEEFFVIGRVGRSSGTFKIPLLIEDNECGGSAILDCLIVKLVDVKTRAVLWQHPQYTLPSMRIVESDACEEKDYIYAVEANNIVHARFKSYAGASHYVAFMAGECMDWPGN